MKSTHFLTAGAKENPHGVDVKIMYNDPSAQALLIILRPGQALKPHTTPVDVFFFVYEGIATVHIGNESEVFQAGTLIESPKDITHYLSNQSDADTRVLVVKAPRP